MIRGSRAAQRSFGTPFASVTEVDLAALRRSRFLRIAKETGACWIADNCPSRAAALSFYAAFSLAPILVIATAVASFIFQHDAVVRAIVAEAQKLLGVEGAQLVERLLVQAGHAPNRGLAALVGLGVLLVGATSAFAELKDSLDAIWRAPKTVTSGIAGLLRARVLSFGLVLSLGFLLLVALIVNTALDAFSQALAAWLGFGFVVIARVSAVLVSVVGVAALFVLIFRFLPVPSVRPSRRVAWRASALTTVLFLAGRAAIGFYLGNTATASAFGAAGSLAVILLWVYYSALIFFFGAEYARILSGEHSRSERPAERTRSPSRARPQPRATSRAAARSG